MDLHAIFTVNPNATRGELFFCLSLVPCVIIIIRVISIIMAVSNMLVVCRVIMNSPLCG